MNKLSQFIIASAKRDKKNIKAIKTKDKLLTPDAFGQVDLSNLEPADNHDSGNNDSNIPSGGVIPDSGMNTDPGKSLSGVEQLWIGPASIASPTDVTLSKTISAVGDGIQLAVQIIKTPITNGQSESTVTLPAVAATDAKPQTGKYVCSVPIPISILAKNLAVGKTINVALDGIGEALSTTKVSQSPVISIYVKDNKTLTITNHQGYALDKTTSGNTGAFYDGQITSANSFTKVAPIPQLPNGTVLYSGVATIGSQITLSKVNSDLSNVGSGIKVYLQDPSKLLPYWSGSGHQGGTISLANLKLTVSNPLVFPRNKLIVGTTLATMTSELGYEKIVVNMDNGQPDTVKKDQEFDQSKLKYFTVRLILSLQKNGILSYTSEALEENSTKVIGSCDHILTLQPTSQTGNSRNLISVLPIAKVVTYTE